MVDTPNGDCSVGGVSLFGAGGWSVNRTHIISRATITGSERKVLAGKQLGRFEANQVAEKNVG